MKYYGNDITSHRNWYDEMNRATERVGGKLIIREATKEEMAKFDLFKKPHKEKWKK